MVEAWSHDTTKITFYVIIGVLFASFVIWVIIKASSYCALDFRPRWKKELEAENYEPDLAEMAI